MNPADSQHLRSWSLLAHELRGRLTAASLSAELLQSQWSDAPPDALNDLRTLRLSLSDCLLKLNGLVTLERLRVGALRPRPAEVPLASLADQLATRFTDAAREASINLHVSGAGVAHTDRILFDLLGSSLLDNAIRHSRGTMVTCRLFASDARWGIEVTDDGVGLSHNALAALTAASPPEFHLEPPTGLRLVRGLADLLGLQVQVATPSVASGQRPATRGTRLCLVSPETSSSDPVGTTDNRG